ncbi:MAG TPA: histidine kinase dimerization/phospho-acceptor domain-containing protein, partial [Burkholderiales bacterium]|nr:histidine kinase dimerization/phospho-acceptor domain-containing protein [Burkholderiales bacterium]
MQRFGLRTKLFLAFGIVLLPVIVLLIINFRTNQGWRESLVLEGQRLAAEAVAVQVDGAFDAAIGFGWAVANDPLIQSMDSNRLDPHLKQLMERHPFYQEISVFDAQGVNRGYGHLTLPAEPRANVKSARYFQSVMATNFPVISEVMELTRPAGAIGVVAATPIRKGNQVIGVVAIVMTAEQLAKRHEETRLLPGQAIVLVDTSAHLAFHSLRRNLSYQASGAFKDLQPLRTALAGISTNAGQFVDPVTNEPCLGAFVPTLRHHWAVGVTMPPSIALAPIYSLWRQQLWTFAGLLLLSALLAYFLARYLVVPFFRLSEAALALGRGDLTRRVDIRTGDEIGLLGDSFNMMAAQIEERDVALREREARIRRLVESNIIGIFFWKLTGELTDANDAFLRMVGYSREDLAEGKVRWTDMTPPQHRALDEKAIDDLLKAGSCLPYDKEYIRKDGGRLPVMIGCAFFEGSRDSGVAFVLDLTERNRAAMELKRHRDHLEERTEQLLVAKERAEFANRAKTEFLAKMSHELRTPLNSVLGYAQILKRGKGLTADQVRGLNAIDENGWQLLSLINDLLNVSQIEAGQIELHYKMVDLAVFMREIVDAIQIKAQEKGLSFTYE